MAKIFWFYWTWHFLLMLIIENYSATPSEAIFIGFLTVLNLCFLVICTVCNIFFSTKSTQTDYIYSKAAIASIITRMLIYAIAVLGLREVRYMLICDGLTIALYFYIKHRMANFPNSKILAVIDDKEDNYKL